MTPGERVEGALFGLFAGLALGAPLRYMSESQILIRHGVVRDFLGGGWLLLRPGEWAADGDLALLLGRSFVEQGGFDAADVSARYAEWYRRDGRKAAGVARRALALLAEGTPREEAAARARELSGEEAGDHGALVRAIPLALAMSDRTALAKAVYAEAGLTHAEPRARAAAVGLAALLSFVLEGRPPRDAFEAAWEFLETEPGGVPNVLPDVPALREGSLRRTGDAIDVLAAATWTSFTAPNLEEAVVRCANRGGDAADAAAGIAGALTGAREGPGATPGRWRRGLADRSGIRELAAHLAGRR